MSKRLWMAGALVALLVPSLQAAHYGKLTWKTGDPEKNMNEAKSLGMPAVLYFTADW